MIFRRCILCFFCAAVPFLLAMGESVTYTVTSYHEVSVSGDEPAGASGVFMSDTKSGSRISADHTAQLDLSGYDGCCVQALTLYMRSNKTGGAGSLQVMIDDSIVASIPDSPFSDAVWWGEYVSDSLVPIVVSLQPALTVPSGACLHIIVEASVNSLYWGACRIDYVVSSHWPKTVSFMTGTDDVLPSLEETVAGSGVVLPDWTIIGTDWHFLGWTENALMQTPARPVYYKAGTRYYPAQNQILYALYSNEDTDASLLQTTTLESGVYAMVTVTGKASMMHGYVDNERVATDGVELRFGADSLYRLLMATVPQDCRYQLNIADGNKATILHIASNTYIGYRATASSHALRSSASEWDVLETANGSWLFCHTPHTDDMVYCLYPQYVNGAYYFKDTDLLPNTSQQFMLLFPVPETEPAPTVFTTNPRSGAGIEGVSAERGYGIYRLDGTCMQTSASAQAVNDLPRGIYIIVSPVGVQKRVIP